MRPTRRGYAALAVAAGAIGLAVVSGPRALNAVAAPLIAAVVFGAIQLRVSGEPTVDLHPVEPGFPGSERVFRIELGGTDVVQMTQPWPTGIEADAIDTVRALPETIETPVTFRDRGRYEVGAPAVRRRDALGMVHERVDSGATTTVVVYPAVERGVGGELFRRALDSGGGSGRDEFAGLREYTPGDPLRSIHWPSSAKRSDLLVAEFEPDDRSASVVIAASARAGAADAMARATATLAMDALEAGLAVGVRVPDATVPPAAGQAHGRRILEVLAGVSPGDRDEDGADVAIEATSAGTQVTIGGVAYRFEDVPVEPDRTAVGEAVVR